MKNRLLLLGVAVLLAVGLTAPAFGGSNVVSSSAAAARSTADKALAKAIKANKKAKAAQATADTAVDAAAAAQATADSALTSANSKYGSVTFQTESASASDQSTKIEASTCPSGKRSVGGGYVLSGGANAAYVTINQPYGNTAWIVQAVDDPTVANNWTLTVAVNCIGS